MPCFHKRSAEDEEAVKTWEWQSRRTTWLLAAGIDTMETSLLTQHRNFFPRSKN
jgi:hypothetical protein